MKCIAFIKQIAASFLRKSCARILFTLAVSFVCMRIPANAQYRIVNIPELRQKIKEAGSDTQRTRLYGVLGWELRFADHAESEKLADEIIRLASPVNDHRRLGEAYKIKGFARVIEQKLQECIDMYALAIDHAKKAGDGYTWSNVTALIAGMYQDKGDFDKMISYYLEALKIAEDHQENEMIAFVSNCIGEAYSDAGRSISVTLPYYQRAKQIEVGLHNWPYVGMICSNIAKDYMLAGKQKEAETAAKESIAYLRKESGRTYVYATVITDIGEMYSGIGKLAEAESYLLEGLHILDSLKTKDNRLIPLSALAKLYVKQKAFDKSEDAAKRLLQLATEYRTKPFLRDGYKVLSDIALEKGQAKEALIYYREYDRWKDSVFNENRERAIANVESRMKLQQKELEVKYGLEKKNRENDDLRRSILGLRYKTIAIVIIALILFALGIMLIILNNSQNRKNKQLEKQKQIIEKQSIEKDTLIREIHHRVKNNLQVISSLLNLQANSLQDEHAIEALRDSHKRVKAISLIHQKLYGFENITAIPLEEYIRALFADLKMMYAAKQVQLECHTDPAELHLDMESAVPVGLILNEAITNAFKYAFAQNDTGVIRITFSENTDDTYTLIIRDNGVGLPGSFDPDRSSSLGFRIIKELSRQLRGTVAYHSNHGVEFILRFPKTSLRNQMA